MAEISILEERKETLQRLVEETETVLRKRRERLKAVESALKLAKANEFSDTLTRLSLSSAEWALTKELLGDPVLFRKLLENIKKEEEEDA